MALDAYEADPGRRKVRAWTHKMLEIRRGDLGRLASSDIVRSRLITGLPSIDEHKSVWTAVPEKPSSRLRRMKNSRRR